MFTGKDSSESFLSLGSSVFSIVNNSREEMETTCNRVNSEFCSETSSVSVIGTYICSFVRVSPRRYTGGLSQCPFPCLNLRSDGPKSRVVTPTVLFNGV